MVDKKNLVIKVKYPSAGKKIESSPNIITTWNVKRILIALASLLLFISLLLYLALKSDEAPVNTSENKVLEVPKAVDQNIKPVATNQTPHVDTHKVIRSLLTYKISNHEPGESLTLPITLSKHKPTNIYYFAELNALNGKTIYHEWYLEDKLITRKKLKVSGDQWRTFSRQYFNDRIKTHWKVRLVDESGQVVNELAFKVIYE